MLIHEGWFLRIALWRKKGVCSSPGCLLVSLTIANSNLCKLVKNRAKLDTGTTCHRLAAKWKRVLL